MKEANPAEYFEKNLHQLGYSDPERALIQTLKEMIDNSLDAAEAGGILPELVVEIEETEKSVTLSSSMTRERKAKIFTVAVEDNGIGIVPDKITFSFGKMLYGSKLFSLRQSRGQQGIGISAAILYSQLTSLEPAEILSKVAGSTKASHVILKVDVEKNEPVVLLNEEVEWKKPHGSRIKVSIPARYSDRVDKYMKELSIGNPHVSLAIKKILEGNTSEFTIERATDESPPQAKDMKPHLYSVDPGIMQRMAEIDTDCKTIASFLSKHFSMISSKTARRILYLAKMPSNLKPKAMKADRVLEAGKMVRLLRPRLDVLSPIGEQNMTKALKGLFSDAEFISAVSRPPWTYRGIPFQIEVGVVMGGESVIDYAGNKRISIIRLANRVPLPYDNSDCVISKAIDEISWGNYGLTLDESGHPRIPVIFVGSIVASKVPYTSPGKFSVTGNEEIKDELRLALQELGRKMRIYLHKKLKEESEMKRAEFFKSYYDLLSEEVEHITGEPLKVDQVVNKLFG
jgi:DNA topoisomerase-6 subunit B